MRISFKAGRCAAVALLAAGGLLAGCDWPKDTVHRLDVTDTTARLSGFPAHLKAGQYNFHLISPMAQPSLQLARLGPDYSLQQLFADVPVVFGPPSKAFPVAAKRLYSHAAFVGGRSEAGQFSTYLTPGHYIAIDTTTNKFQTFAVDPAKVLANYPAANLNVGGFMGMKNGKDAFAWDVRGTFTKSGTIKFTNLNGDEPHFLSIAHLHPGKTQTECINYSGAPGPNAPCDPVLGTGLLSPLTSMTIGYAFQNPGQYVLACFVSNAETGIPHAMLGMVKTITLH